MRISRTVVSVVAVAGLLTTMTATVASAVDTNTTVATAVAAGGSDTTDELTGALSNLPSLSGDLANYNALGTANADTTANYPAAARVAGANCVATRPNGSGAGKNALSAAMRGAAYGGSTNYAECLGLARSSSNSFPSGANAVPSGTMARIPVAVDSVTPAVLKSSTVQKRFTFDFLKSVYTRNGVAGTAACLGVTPLVPQFNSGTRGFWAEKMGVTDYNFSGGGAAPATQTWGSCVTGGAANPLGFGTGAGNGVFGDQKGGAPIQEHAGTFLSGPTEMVPYSVSQYITQGSGIISDTRGNAVLASVEFTTVGNPSTPATFAVNNAALRHPWVLNATNGVSGGYSGPRGDLTRTVFNFVPRALYDAAYTPPAGATGFSDGTGTDKARFAQAFVGAGSDVCQATSTIALYGFTAAPDCGVVTLNP